MSKIIKIFINEASAKTILLMPALIPRILPQYNLNVASNSPRYKNDEQFFKVS
jgi:hypothetical protein